MLVAVPVVQLGEISYDEDTPISLIFLFYFCNSCDYFLASCQVIEVGSYWMLQPHL